MANRVIGLIPARKGSKRLPGKNKKYFINKPLIEYSISASLNSKLITETYISSDDEFIQEIAQKNRVNFILRPDIFANDRASTSEVLMHICEVLKLDQEDLIVTIQPTNPLRPKGLIDAILDFSKDQDSEWDSLNTVSLTKLKFGILQNGFYQPINYKQGDRSQDIKNIYFNENGLLYVTKVKTLTKYGNMFGEKVLGYVTDSAFSSADIDTMEDFTRAESLYISIREKFNLL